MNNGISSGAFIPVYRSIIFADQLGRTESLNINIKSGAKKCRLGGAASASYQFVQAAQIRYLLLRLPVGFG